MKLGSRGGPRARTGCWNDTHVRGRPDHHGRSAGQGHRHSAKEPHQPRRSRARTIAGARVCRRALGHSEGARELPTAGGHSTMPRAPRAHRCSTRRLSRWLMSPTASDECSGSINAAQCSPSVRHRAQQQTVRTAPSAAVTSAEIAPFHRLLRPPPFPPAATTYLRPSGLLLRFLRSSPRIRSFHVLSDGLRKIRQPHYTRYERDMV